MSRRCPSRPAPTSPTTDEIGEGCGEAAVTDPADVGVDRAVARCAPGSPEAAPLATPATVRVATTARSEAVAPLLVADALGELEAENLQVEIVELDASAAYEAMAAGDVDVVVGGIDAPFFDAVHEGLDARLVMGGPITRSPGDLETPQAGLWLRADVISAEDDWENVEGQTVLLPGGMGSGAVYPIDTTLSQNELSVNSVDLVAAPAAEAAARLVGAEVGAAWLPEPVPDAVADDEALRLIATLPGSESIDGTVLAPRLLGADRAVGLGLRAGDRPHDQHPPLRRLRRGVAAGAGGGPRRRRGGPGRGARAAVRLGAAGRHDPAHPGVAHRRGRGALRAPRRARPTSSTAPWWPTWWRPPEGPAARQADAVQLQG